MSLFETPHLLVPPVLKSVFEVLLLYIFLTTFPLSSTISKVKFGLLLSFATASNVILLMLL